MAITDVWFIDGSYYEQESRLLEPFILQYQNVEIAMLFLRQAGSPVFILKAVTEIYSIYFPLNFQSSDVQFLTFHIYREIENRK